ncbi:MAG: hypothetical protein K2G53_03670 [Muribaculaceae bacterium]|nr:hypothetical protein [Muribaculaceae bacterium]
MNNDIFSTIRFFNYIKQYACENKKKLITFGLAIVGVLIFTDAILPFINGTYNYAYDYDPMWAKEQVMFWTMLYIGIAVGGANAFNTYDSKGKRIYSLTLPVSNLEKFLTYILFYGLGVYVCSFIGEFVGDCIRTWTAPFYATEGSVIEPMPLKYLFSLETTSVDSIRLITMMVFASLITIQAYFVLAGTIWPKYGMMRGFLSLIAIYMILGMVVYLSFQTIFAIHGHLIVFRFEETLRNLDKYITVNYVITAGYILGCLTAIGLYLLAYLRFKEMESIERW